MLANTGSDSGREMMDGKCLHGNHATLITEERKAPKETEHVFVRLWYSDRGAGRVCVLLMQRGRKRQWEKHRACVSFQVCVYVFVWWQNKRPPLSCVALGILHGFRPPSARGALWPSLELPVCLFPHRRLAKQQGPPPLPRVRSLSTPGKLWSDGQKKGVWEGFGNFKLCVSVCMCVWCGSRQKDRGMVRVRWG